MAFPNGGLGIQSAPGHAHVVITVAHLASLAYAQRSVWALCISVLGPGGQGAADGDSAPPGLSCRSQLWSSSSPPSSPPPVPVRPSSCCCCSTLRPSAKSSRSWQSRGSGTRAAAGPGLWGAVRDPGQTAAASPTSTSRRWAVCATSTV